MKKRKLSFRSHKLKEDFNFKKRDNLKKDFFELLKRASKTTDFHS
jgi:hypothetical protein